MLMLVSDLVETVFIDQAVTVVQEVEAGMEDQAHIQTEVVMMIEVVVEVVVMYTLNLLLQVIQVVAYLIQTSIYQMQIQ
jgi:hypothetical protein